VNKQFKFLLAAISVLSFNSTLYCQFYTGSQMQFGKNRVQYEKFEWTYLDYGSYKVYFYQGGEKTADYVAIKAKEYINSLSSLMDYQAPDKINFIVYNKESEYKESNLGLPGD
jgi:hypothetical protein